MTINGISSINGYADRLKAFQSGQANIQKSDLQAVEDKLKSTDPTKAAKIDQLIQSFDKIDTNGDGISAQEFSTYQKSQGATARPAGGHHHHHGGGKGAKPVTKDDLVSLQNQIQSDGGTAPDGLSTLINSFDQADTDKDGAISATEFQAFAKANGIQLPSDSSQSASADSSVAAAGVSSTGSSGSATQSSSDLSLAKLFAKLSGDGNSDGGKNDASGAQSGLLQRLIASYTQNSSAVSASVTPNILSAVQA